MSDVAQRRKPYQMHVYLPVWMKDAIKQAAAKKRGWTAQLFVEVAIERALLREGFKAPPDEADTERS